MKTKNLLRYALKYATFCFVFFWTAFSVNAQCPTIPDPTPTAICDASGFTFEDLNAYASGSDIVWYNLDTGGVAYVSNQLVSEGTYYAGNSLGACAPRPSITISFQVNDSGQSLDGIYCSNENPTVQTYIDDVLLSNIPSGGSVEVYDDFKLTTLASGTDAIPSGGSFYYIVFVDNGGCKSQTEIGSTAIFDSPSDPTPSSSQEFCSDINPTIADLDPGTAASYNWYANIDGFGDPIQPALSPSAALVDGATYYVQIDEIFCDSNAIPITVTIDDPYNPGTSADLEYCSGSIPTSDFNLFEELGAPKDTNGSWSGPLTTSNGHLGTVNISTLTVGIHSFIYTVPSNGSCEEKTSSVSITIYETFTSGNPSTNNPAIYCEKDLPTDFDLFSLLQEHDLNGQWTQGTTSSDPVVTSTIDLTSLTASGSPYHFTYTQNVSPNPCPEESTTVQVIVLADPNAGVANNQTFCENDLVANSPFDLFDALDGSQDNNSGTWRDASNNIISDPVNVDITGFTAIGSPYQFTYTISNGTCDDTEIISIIIEPAPESGEAITVFPEYCEGAITSGQLVNLFDLLDGTQDTNGTWYEGTDTSGSGTVVSNSIDITSFTANIYNFTYSVPDIGICLDKDVTVQIIIHPQPNTGTPSPATFCENDLGSNPSLNLFDQLTSPYDSGGTWIDDNIPVTGALSGSNVDLTLLEIDSYNFTYSITENGCTSRSTVVVTITSPPEPGTPIPTFPEYCEGAAPLSFDLYSLIDGESGTGTWTNNNTSTEVVDPNNLDLSAFTADTYNFTFDIDDLNGCDTDDVVVRITINPLPNTGIPNNPPPFCENDPALSNTSFDLFTLLDAPVDAGGQWYVGADTTGTIVSNILDLTTLINIQVYNYTYGITDANVCSNSTTVAITVVEAPESGEAITIFPEYCKAAITPGQMVNLFDLLDGTQDTNGTWYEGTDTSGSGTVVTNSIDISSFTENTYDFTYSVPDIVGCSDDDVTVSIIINDTPAPTADTPQEFCDSATVANLVTTSGTSIQWYDAVTGGNLLADATALVDGLIYYASQTDATTGCESSVRTGVTATIYQSPNAGGLSTTPIVACNDGTIDLTSGLDGTQDLGGTWYEGSDNTGTVVVNPTAYVVPVLANNYQFTYYVVASAPCVDDSTTITVTIETPLNAGTDGLPLELCSNDGTIDLFTQLGGSPDTGGTWSPAMASTTGVFDPLVDASGIYMYSLTNACGTFSSQIEVTVTQAPNAGSDNTALICVIDGVTDLFSFLGTSAQSGGSWTYASTSVTGQFDPSVDAPGIYTYTVAATGPCSPDSVAEITVTVSDTPAPVVVEANPEFCLVDNPIVSDLNSALTLTGTINWYEDAALTIVANPADNLIDGEDYYATQTNSDGCESSTSSTQVTAIINDIPAPTLADATM